MGLAYIAAVIKGNGYKVEIYNQDLHHYPEAHLTEYLNKNSFDIVGVSLIAGYYQYRKILKISEAINKSKNRPLYILGGHGPSPEPAFFLKKTQADVAVIGEGEVTIIELLNAIGNKESLDNVNGIAFREGDSVKINRERPLVQDIDSLPFPAYDMFPMKYYRLLGTTHSGRTEFTMPFLSGRGCTFTCSFCYRMDTGFRPRKNEAIIEEISFLKQEYGVTFISFNDELLMSSIERTVSLCEAFITADLNIKWDCNGRLNYAKPGPLELMKKAGCVHINYGIEAMDDEVLKNIKKGLTTTQIIKGVENTLKVGISPGLNIIFGNLGDTKETLSKGVEFLLKYDDGAQMRTIRPVTPYPGSSLYYYAIEKGLLKDVEDFYENKHINSDLLSVNFTDMSDDEFHLCLMDANLKLIENFHRSWLVEMSKITKDLYINRNAQFRGYRQT
jgi:radical SAM superfamily enzyme YgiQ (UPF0313 family)